MVSDLGERKNGRFGRSDGDAFVQLGEEVLEQELVLEPLVEPDPFLPVVMLRIAGVGSRRVLPDDQGNGLFVVQRVAPGDEPRELPGLTAVRRVDRFRQQQELPGEFRVRRRGHRPRFEVEDESGFLFVRRPEQDALLFREPAELGLQGIQCHAFPPRKERARHSVRDSGRRVNPRDEKTRRRAGQRGAGTPRSSSAIQAETEAEVGMRQSPRWESETDPIFGPSGAVERLNWLQKKRFRKARCHFLTVARSYVPSKAWSAMRVMNDGAKPKRSVQ